MSDFASFMREASRVAPSKRQQAWFDTELYAFIHFGVNTFTGREWGLGNEDEAIFNPEKLDCDQWVAALKAGGARGLVITAKHHDGFCLWPTATTKHSVASSPWRGGKGDVVKEAAEACRRGGLKFGVYLSPWDRNSQYYGTDQYNDFYKAQLRELLTNYGELFMVWFDGACGEGPNGRKQVYDFPGYIALIRELQPNAAIFNDKGPDVRWVGNESGTARYAEWAVTPSELSALAEVQTGPGPLAGDMSYLYNTQHDIGSLATILYSKGLCFCGAETDMSIRPGWFWHPEEEPHSLERLMRTYVTSVGGNACFNLNVPPTTDGLLDERDVKRLREFGDACKAAFASPIPCARKDEINGTQAEIHLALPEARDVGHVILAEDLSQGQRVESFLVQSKDEYGRWNTVYQGTTIGHKRICPVKARASELRVLVVAARDEVHMKDALLCAKVEA